DCLARSAAAPPQLSLLALSVPPAQMRSILLILLPAGMTGNDWVGSAVSKRTCVHCVGSWPAAVGEPLEQPPTKWNVSGPVAGRATTLKRGAPAPQWPPLR